MGNFDYSRDTWPEFMELLDSNPSRSRHLLGSFLNEFLRKTPPSNIRDLPADRRSEVLSNLFLTLTNENFRKLRLYTNQGKPFTYWLTIVCRNVIRELVRSQDGKELSLEIDDEDEGRKKSDPPDLKPTPELDAELTESVEIINRFIEKLRKRCQVLIRTAAEEEVKPAEMPLLIGEPNTSAIKISNDLRFCRQTLCKLLQDSGYGDLVPFCRTKR